MAFKIDRSSATGFSDEILSVALLGKHTDNKYASPKEVSFARNILASQDARRSSRFMSLTRGIKKGYPNSSIIPVANSGIEFHRQIASEKLIHQIGREYRKIENASVGSVKYKYERLAYPVVTMDVAAKMRTRDAAKRNPIYSRGTARFDSANPIYTDTNWAYREAGSTPTGISFFAPVTKEQADKWNAQRMADDELRRKIDAAEVERDRRYGIGLKNYRRDTKSDYERERDDLIERYGGAANPLSERMADDELGRRARVRTARAEASASIRRKSERIDLAKRYPMLKRFFLDSRNSTKDIHRMAESLKGVGKIPLLGKLVGMHPAGAAISGAVAIAGLISALLDKQNAANIKTTNWEVAGNYFGTPSKEFESAARSVGIKDPSRIAGVWGKISRLGISPDIMFRQIGRMTYGQHPAIKQAIGEQFGIGPEGVMLAETLAGISNISEARRVSSRLGALETEQEFGFRSGSSLSQKRRSFDLLLPFSKDIEARYGISYPKLLKYNFAPLQTAFADITDWISAAISDGKYDSKRQDGALRKTILSEKGMNNNWYGTTIVLPDAHSMEDVAKDASRTADAKTERIRAMSVADPGSM